MMEQLNTAGFNYATIVFFLHLLLSQIPETRSEDLDVTKCDRYIRRTNGVVCYSVVDTPDKWTFAQMVCNARNMTMLEILTDDENKAVLDLLTQKNMVDSWLGALQSSETWRWLDGSELMEQGCFRDNRTSPDMKGDVVRRDDNSPSTCMEYCANRSYPYASVEAGVECRCDFEFGKYGQEGAYCVSPCPGDPKINCGGDSVQQVFAVGGSYSHWLPGQPNNDFDYQSCATADSSTDFKWQDVSCINPYRVLCEIPKVNDTCSNTQVLINNRCILATETNANFFKARFNCRSFGGDLLMHVSAEDSLALSKQLNPGSNSTVQYYIGLTKWAWKWAQTDNEFLYTNWKNDQPTGPNFNCVTIKRDTTPGEWADISCDTSRLYICQKSNATEKVTVPLFTVAPRPTSRRTAPPPLTTGFDASSTPTQKPGATSTRDPARDPSYAPNESHASSINTAAVIGGAVAGGVVFIIIVIFIIICIITAHRNKQSTSKPKRTEAVIPPEVDPFPPTYFFGVETTPKYRNEKSIYPALPTFDEKTRPDSTVGRHKGSLRRTLSDISARNNKTAIIGAEYSTTIALPIYDNTPTQYSSDIFINPELSY